MSDKKTIGPFYKQVKNSENYICTETNKQCEYATQHFAEFNRFLKKHNRAPCYTHVRNLCEERNCPVWREIVKKAQKTR